MSKRSLAIAAAGVDQFKFNSVSLLLSGDGTNGAQNNTFLDSSSNNYTITRYGNSTQGSFSPFQSSGAYSTSANGGSGFFDGTGDYLTVPYTAAFDLSVSSWTMEAWVYIRSFASANVIIGKDTHGQNYDWGLLITNNTTLQLYTAGTAASLTVTVPALQTNTWYHIAYVRNSGTNTIYLNGVSYGSNTMGISNSSQSYVTIGCGSWNNPGAFVNGYISSLRVVKGTAVYTSNFTPPTSPLTNITNTSLLLNFTNAGIYDSAMKHNLETFGNARVSTSVKKYGTGSMYFDGSGDYLKIQNSSTQFGLGTGDFTAEAWVYLQGTTLYYPNVFNIATADNNANNRLGISFGNGGYGYKLFFGVGGALYIIDAYTQTSFNNVWRHVAVSRNSGIVRCFVDGVLVNTATNTADLGSSAYFYVGNFFNEYGSSYFWNGYMDDIRITKGVGLYTANFTPPTQALPNN